MKLLVLAMLSGLTVMGPVVAAEPALPTVASLSAQAATRFPQPVRVGDLIGRQVLTPTEQQAVLGRVTGVVRGADGGVLMVVSVGGVLGVGARPVAVPVEAMALLGEHVDLVGYTPAQLAALPRFDGAGTSPVGADETIRVGLRGPAH